MTLAHYDALTARAFDRHDANFDAGEPPASGTIDAIKQHNERMDRVSRASAAVGLMLLHLGVPCLGAIAWWLST